MNQKLHTARSGIVILFAVLCIVCLSLSLVLSAQFAAYAESENNGLALKDDKGQDLWLIYYEGQEAGESLWDGTHEGSPISYIDSVRAEDGSDVISTGSNEQNFFAPYRGTELTLKLNPNYEINGKSLSELYDLENAEYSDNIGGAEAERSIDMSNTTVVAQSLIEDEPALQLKKEWKIAVLCNLVEVQGTYIADRAFADDASLDLLRPVLGDIVVYDIRSIAGYERTIAVKYGANGDISYLQAGKDDSGFFLSKDDEGNPISWDQTDIEAAHNENVNLINYFIHRLDALVANAQDGLGAYTLTVAAFDLPAESGEIQYAQSSVKYDFSVVPQGLGDDAENDQTFDHFDLTIDYAGVDYTGGNEWIDNIGLKLSLNGIELVKDVDYTLTSESNKVGPVDLRIVGIGNLTGYHTIRGRIHINPARNDWEVMPNIITWVYGTYKPENNLIVGRPIFLDNPNDIRFRIVKLIQDKNGNIIEESIEALSDIHYYVYTNADSGELTTNWIVTDDVIAALETLDVGNYRLYASVYGVNNTDTAIDRNYQPISERSVDFEVFKGLNRWKAGSEPTILGWTTGKLDSTDGLMNAESVFGTPVLMIYDIEDNLIYSNLPRHANTEFGDINVLKGLKAGRYYLSAEVEGTSNYDALRATVLFDVVPNNLPIWAVILIVAGSLGIVALVFGILHQKGVLQMLTGKVIISMRTRANVDATLAAIRAAKVARDAEASIAAAKAREAEEQKKAENSDNK